MNDYLSKPLRRDELEKTVACWSAARRQGSVRAAPLPTCRPARIQQAAEARETTAVTSSQSRPEALDLSVLRQLEAETGREALCRMLSRFLTEMPERLAAIAEGLSEEQATPEILTAVQRHSHSLKSAAATFGALPLSRLSADLEAAAKAGDWTAVRRLSPDLPVLVAQTREAIARQVPEAKAPGLPKAPAA